MFELKRMIGGRGEERGKGLYTSIRILQVCPPRTYSSPSLPQSFSLPLSYASQQDLAVMRKVYDFCSQHGVYPEISQYNR